MTTSSTFYQASKEITLFLLVSVCMEKHHLSLRTKPTVHLVITMLATSEMSYFQVITTC